MINLPIFTAQHKEDIILAEIFNTRNGFFVEVGGYDGIRLSNSYFFETMGWRGLIVEPIPDLCEKLKKQRKCIIVQAAASDRKAEIDFYISDGCEVLSTCGFRSADLNRISEAGASVEKIVVQALTLDSIFEENNVDQIDFISIDVEGAELSVLRGLSLKVYKPRIIIVEANDVVYDPRVHNFLIHNDYRRFKVTGCNQWYASKSDSLVTLSAILAAKFRSLFPTVKSLIKTFFPKKLIRLILNLKNIFK